MTIYSTGEVQNPGHLFNLIQLNEVLPGSIIQLYTSREVFNLYYVQRRWLVVSLFYSVL